MGWGCVLKAMSLKDELTHAAQLHKQKPQPLVVETHKPANNALSESSQMV